MNKQDLFNKAYVGVLVNGFSFNQSNDVCAYRSSGQADDPVRCGIGHCIPDDVYDPTIEGKGVSEALRASPSLRDALGLDYSDDLLFLEELQDVHDDACANRDAEDFDDIKDLEAYRKNMRLFAKGHGLILPTL